jgi:hypothetical protein
VDEALRSSLVLALVASLAGGLAVVSTKAHRRWVAPCAAVGLWLAAVPLWLQG